MRESGPVSTGTSSGPSGLGAGGGECGALVRALDWARTPLGPAERWPGSLRTAASICLESHYGMCVFWGPELVAIYNDAYVPMLGDKHPAALGKPLREIWPEIWDQLEPMLDGVRRDGAAHVAGGPAAAAGAQGLPGGGLLHLLLQPDPRRVGRGRRHLHGGARGDRARARARAGCRRSPGSARAGRRADGGTRSPARRSRRSRARARTCRSPRCTRSARTASARLRGRLPHARTAGRRRRAAAAAAGERVLEDGARRRPARAAPGRRRARRRAGARGEPAPPPRRGLPRLLPHDRAPALRGAVERGRPGGGRDAAPTSWRRWTTRRPSSSPTSRTSSARR